MTFISVKKMKGFNYAITALNIHVNKEKKKETRIYTSQPTKEPNNWKKLQIKEIGVFQGAS